LTVHHRFFTLESFSITKAGSDIFRADLVINAVILTPEGGGAGENILPSVSAAAEPQNKHGNYKSIKK